MPFARAIACLFLVLTILPASAWADDDRDDAERASRGTRSGEFLPFARLAEIVLGRFPGKIVEAELDEDDGRIVYEVRILRPNGRVTEVEIDAGSGRIVDVDEDD